MSENQNLEAQFALATIRQLVSNMDGETALRIIQGMASTIHEGNAVVSLEAVVGRLPIKEFPLIQRAALAVGDQRNLDQEMVKTFVEKLARQVVRAIRK